MPRIRTTPVLLAVAALAATSAGRDARAENCLAGPNAQSPAGKHWYYRIDRATQRKCWYLGALRAQTHRAVAERKSSRPAPADVTDDDVAAAAPPPAPATDPAPQPAFESGLPAGAPPARADAAPAEPVAPVAAATLAPAPVATRAVPTTTERMRAPEPAKPPAAAPREAAPPAPAAPGGERGALPAALIGVAFLLAAVGTMLVRARRRMIRVHGEAGRSVFAGAARPPGTSSQGSGRARRTLSDILAQAEQRDAQGRAAREAEFLRRLRRGLGELPVAAAPEEGAPPADIAAATLQPAIDVPPVPAEPIAPAPDVEQTLRQLLANWERRAA
jgi:hypothetical protein